LTVDESEFSEGEMRSQMALIRRHIARLLQSRLVGGTAIMTLGNGLRLLFNLGTFFIVARAMGSADFGNFATVVSLVGILGAFAGWGADQLVIRRVSRSTEAYRDALGTSTVFLAISAPVLTLVSWMLVPILMHRTVSFEMVALVSIADLVFQPINVLAAGCFQGSDRPAKTALQNIGFSLMRVVAALLWVAIIPAHDTISWSWFYCTVSLLGATASIVVVVHDLGLPRWNILWTDWKNGFHFALQQATFSVFREIDRPVILNLSSAATVGVYVAAFRLADAAVMPVRSLMYASHREFFRLGGINPRLSLRFAFKLMPFCIGFGLLGGAAIAAAAPVAPFVLGRQYEGTFNLLLLLSAFPMLYGFFYLAMEILVGADHATMRTAIQLVMPAFDIGFCYLLVPGYGAVGAALATLATHAITVVSAWGAVALIVMRSPALEHSTDPRATERPR